MYFTPHLKSGAAAGVATPYPRPGVAAGSSYPMSKERWLRRCRMATGEGNGKPLQYSCLENTMNAMEKQNDRILKEELPRSVGAHYATGDQWRNNSRKNEGMEPKQKQHPVVDVTGDRSKVRCCKEQYCIFRGEAKTCLLLASNVFPNY